jgi:hypothetical protein
MLRPLLVNLDGGSGFGSELRPTPPTLNARLPDYLTACFFRGLFKIISDTYFLFFRGS